MLSPLVMCGPQGNYFLIINKANKIYYLLLLVFIIDIEKIENFNKISKLNLKVHQTMKYDFAYMYFYTFVSTKAFISAGFKENL